LTSADTCTHRDALEENSVHVAACKAASANEATCEAVKFEGTTNAAANYCYIMKYATATCGGTATADSYGSTGSITVDGTSGGAAATTLAECKAGCDLLGDKCFEFYFDDDTSKTCTYYSGKCTETGTANVKDQIYQRVPCCYWTSPTLITADSICANEAEVTMNNKAAAAWSTGYEFGIVYNDNVAYTKESCQKLCVDFEENC
jgi:hypothetical protein